MPGLDHRGVYLPITAFMRADFNKVLRIERRGVPVDLTGDSFEAQVLRREGTGTEIVNLSPTILGPPTDGVVTIAKSAIEMDLTPGTYWWYWRWIDASAPDVIPMFYGPFNLRRYP